MGIVGFVCLSYMNKLDLLFIECICPILSEIKCFIAYGVEIEGIQLILQVLMDYFLLIR